MDGRSTLVEDTLDVVKPLICNRPKSARCDAPVFRPHAHVEIWCAALTALPRSKDAWGGPARMSVQQGRVPGAKKSKAIAKAGSKPRVKSPKAQSERCPLLNSSKRVGEFKSTDQKKTDRLLT